MPNKNCNNTSKLSNNNESYSGLSYLHNPGEEPLLSLTIGQLLEKTVETFGDNLAIISRYQNVRLTYRQVLQEADTLAAGLRVIGLEKGDRLALWAPNLIEWYITKMACARAGFILVALNSAYQPAEMEYCLNKVGAKAVICADKFKTQNYYKHLLTIAPELEKSQPGKLKSSKFPNLKVVIVLSEEARPGTYLYKEILDLPNENDIKAIKTNQHLVQLKDPCNILFTSGTTGQAQPACASHFSYVNNAYFCGKRIELRRKHHIMCVQVPFFHAFGTIAIVGAASFGSTLVLPDQGYNPDKILDSIEDENCTIILGTPTMYVDLVQKQKERKADISPDIAVCGGAPCPAPLFEDMLNVLKLKKVKSVYGLTEVTGSVFQSLEDDGYDQIATTVGHLGEHFEVKVVDSDHKIVPLGTPGELYIKGYGNILGYWNDEEKTKELIGPDGWLRTGDKFILMENGYGKIVGRLKEMIIRGGENIVPAEIEDFLMTHPSIFDIQVIGLPHERLGEEVCACVKLRPGANLTHEGLVEFCRGKISHFKIPSKLVIVEEFPKTTSGKIQKFKLKDIVTENSTNGNGV